MNGSPNPHSPHPGDDGATSIEDLRTLVREFVDAGLEAIPHPQNLSMALSIEAGELMEHFQWLTPEASRQVAADPAKRAEVGEEMADVLCYLLAIANELNLDVASTMRAKMVKNEQKYPVAEFRGRYGPEDQGPPVVSGAG